MKNLFFVLMLISVLLLFSCVNDDPPCCAHPPFTGINLTVVDTSGNDLLNPENPEAYSKDSIRLYFLENGETHLVHNELSDNPNGFSINPGISQQNYRISLSPTLPTADQKTTITYLHWNSEDIDTLKSKYAGPSSGTQYVDTLWVNGEKKPSFSEYDYNPAEIIKNR